MGISTAAAQGTFSFKGADCAATPTTSLGGSCAVTAAKVRRLGSEPGRAGNPNPLQRLRRGEHPVVVSIEDVDGIPFV
jgi:hypothetical protein